MNKNDVGRVIAVNVGEDISTATDWAIFLAFKNITKEFTRTENGVALGEVDLTFEDPDTGEEVTYIAFQYLTYTTQAGDINYSGVWEGRSKVSIDGQVLMGDIDFFIVGE